MTDLKTANEQLAHALKALESLEHDTDVREAEACRNRLMELDERIGARIKAKLEAHRLIAQAWSPVTQTDLTQEAIDDRARYVGFVEEGDNFVKFEGGHVLWGKTLGKGITTVTKVESGGTDGLTAEAWQAHHEEHAGKYALAGEEVPDRVMVNGVAEMQQAAVSDEQ